MFRPLQPYCRAARTRSGQRWPSWVCRISRRHSHPSCHQETRCEKIGFTPKHHTEVLLSSWRHLPDWGWVGSCFTAERESLDPEELNFRARDTLGLPAWPPGLENHHLLFFTKIARPPQRRWVNRVPQDNICQPKHLGPTSMSGASRDRRIFHQPPVPVSLVSLLLAFFPRIRRPSSRPTSGSLPQGSTALIRGVAYHWRQPSKGPVPAHPFWGVKKLGYLSHLKYAAGSVGQISFFQGPFHIWNRLEVIMQTGASC